MVVQYLVHSYLSLLLYKFIMFALEVVNALAVCVLFYLLNITDYFYLFIKFILYFFLKVI